MGPDVSAALLVLAAVVCARLSLSNARRGRVVELAAGSPEPPRPLLAGGRRTWSSSRPLGLSMTTLGGAAGGVLGWYLAGPVGALASSLLAPLMGRWRRRRRAAIRREALEGQLAEAADALVYSLRSGLSVLQALETAARDADEPMASFLRVLAREQRLGSSLRVALDRLAGSVGSEEARFLALVIALHHRSGGNLADAVEELARSIRHRITVRRELRALAAQGRASAAVLTGLPVAFFFFLAISSREELAPVYRSSAGMAMLTAGFVLQFLGYVWMRHLLRIRV